MRNHFNKVNESSVQSRLFIFLGILWIIVWIILLTKADALNVMMSALLGAGYCQTCTGYSLATILLLVILFFIGGLGVSFGIANKSRKNYIARIVAFAFAVSLASLPVYGWAYLSFHGL